MTNTDMQFKVVDGRLVRVDDDEDADFEENLTFHD